MAQRSEIEAAFTALPRPQAFRDYGPNGLQVEGRAEVRRLVSGVTASLAFIDAAVAAERYGAPAVAAQIAARFGIEHPFIEIDNPA